MFRRNESHRQSELFGSQTLLSEQKRQKLANYEADYGDTEAWRILRRVFGEQEGYRVSCPHQSVVAARTPKKWKAKFDRSICSGCPLAGQFYKDWPSSIRFSSGQLRFFKLSIV